MASNDNPSEKDLKSTSQEFEQDVQPYSDHSIKERDDEADPVHDGELKRELTPSQITMIAIGGSIGELERRSVGRECFFTLGWMS